MPSLDNFQSVLYTVGRSTFLKQQSDHVKYCLKCFIRFPLFLGRPKFLYSLQGSTGSGPLGFSSLTFYSSQSQPHGPLCSATPNLLWFLKLLWISLFWACASVPSASDIFILPSKPCQANFTRILSLRLNINSSRKLSVILLRKSWVFFPCGLRLPCTSHDGHYNCLYMCFKFSEGRELSVLKIGISIMLGSFFDTQGIY